MKLRSPFLAISIGCLTAAIFNSLGWLQISERKLYDFYLRLRPLESPEQKIVIVGLNEPDIEKLGFPIDDKTLATLLTKIKLQNPRVIGLDLHRNVNIGTQNKELKTIFSSTPQLIGVEKTDGGNPNHQTISPPKELAKRGQTGASEIIEDGESGIVRRGYLYVRRSNKSENLPSFALAMALKYLEEENIFPVSSGTKNWLKLGKTVFPMLQFNRLFYPSWTIDNYQTIINYRSQSGAFLEVSVSEVLNNENAGDLLQDKIVIIGTTAETIKDIYTTPYDYNTVNFNFSYGVEIHGNLASQIINSALYNRVAIDFLNPYWQYGGILFLLTVTSFVSWYLYYQENILKQKKTIIPLACSLFSAIAIFGVSYLFLLFGWWIPAVTSIVTILSSQTILYIFIKLKQLEQANTILTQKVQERTQALEEAQQKILSQEKLSLYQKLSRYVAHEIKNKTNIIGLNIQNSQTDLTELQLIIEDNSFIFEEISDSDTRSPNFIISDLNDKLSRMEQINQKVTSIINEIYRYQENNNVTTAIDIHQLLERVLSDAIQIYKIKHSELKIAIERHYEDNLQEINCIASDIERALDNIVNNAFYYLAKKNNNLQNYQPRLTVSTQKKQNSVIIKIKDNGIGIPAENINKIFTMFWTTKTLGESMGIGLHFAKELIEKNSGSISVDSIEGEYTEFIVTLPSPLDLSQKSRVKSQK